MTASGRRPRTRLEERAYGSQHRARRAHLLAELERVGFAPCPRCGLPMVPGQRLHLDHSDPAAKQLGLPGDRLTHATCNEADGGRIGNAMMRAMASGMLPLAIEDKPEHRPPTEAEIDAAMERIGQDYGHRGGCGCSPMLAQGGAQSRCRLSPSLAYIRLVLATLRAWAQESHGGFPHPLGSVVIPLGKKAKPQVRALCYVTL